MVSVNNKQKKGRSVQELIGIKSFTKYGLMINDAEIVLYIVQPVNISVLSDIDIEFRIRKLMTVLSAIPDIEITCTDSCERFDDNKMFMHSRIEAENNPKVKDILQKDIDFFDSIQTETATARQFMFSVHFRNMKPEQVFQNSNRIEKAITDQGFDVRKMIKEDIKRMLGVYFETSVNGELLSETEGEQYL